MKLFIQINCLNERDSLQSTLADLPTSIEGIDSIEVMIVDDGSSDGTGELANQLGIKHVIRHNQNRGLPAAVNTGLKYALEHGADIVVNTDADNQYKGSDIKRLVEPLLRKEADFSYGERNINTITHFSAVKRYLQRVGALVVSTVIGLRIHDAASGFRAVNREAMQKLYLLSDYASPLETLIQARMKKIGIIIIPVTVNKTERSSRIVKSIPKYIIKSAVIILDNVIIYRPLLVFLGIGSFLSVAGVIMWFVRYILVVRGSDSLHLTLLVGAVFLFIAGIQLMALGILTRILRANRIMLEEIRSNQF